VTLYLQVPKLRLLVRHFPQIFRVSIVDGGVFDAWLWSRGLKVVHKFKKIKLESRFLNSTRWRPPKESYLGFLESLSGIRVHRKLEFLT